MAFLVLPNFILNENLILIVKCLNFAKYMIDLMFFYTMIINNF